MGWFDASGTLGLVAEYFLKTTAVLTLALLAATAARRRPAAFRHFVLSFALVGLLLLPMLSIVPFGWRTSLLPARPAETRARAVPPARPYGFRERTRASDLDIRSFERQAAAAQETAPPDGAEGRTAELRAERPSEPTASVMNPDPDSSSSPLLRRAAVIRPRDGGDGVSRIDIVLAVLWSVGLLVLALRLAVGLAGAVKLTAEGQPLAGADWRVLLERFMELVSLRRKIRLRSHPEVLVPLTWGWRKPVVLMPAGTDGWTEEERSSALFHELSHVKRADFLVMLAVRASLAVFWWNPLCWVVYRELRKEQEIACDELVLRAGIRPSTYAASLLAFRRSAGFRWNPSAALLGMLGRASFPERLAAILRQKLTFKEVKMKTRIMLAATVVLAVAFIGTARPAEGIEKTASTTTVVETAMPVADAIAIDLALPAAETQETKAEKAAVQEKKKEKAAAEKKIDVTVKEIGKAPIVITITEGDVVKTLTLDKPLTITGGKDGHVLVLTSEGKEIQVLKGEPLRLEIKGGEIEVLREGKAVKIGEGGAYTIVKEGGKDGRKIVFYGTPESKDADAGKLHIITEDVGKEGEVTVVVGTKKEGEPAIAWTVKEPGKSANVWVAKDFSGKPGASAVWVAEGGKAFAFSPAGNKELLEKVRAIQEQLAAVKAKKMDIAALEESLKRLEVELQANEEKLDKLKIKLEKAPGEVAVVKKIREDEAKGDVVVYEKIRGDKAEGAATAWVAKVDEAPAIAKVGIFTEDNTIQILLSGIEGGKGSSAYPLGVAAVDRLKKDLPEGYKILESKYDKEAGTMTFKIAPPEGAKVDEKLVRKIVDSLKAELKSKK